MNLRNWQKRFAQLMAALRASNRGKTLKPPDQQQLDEASWQLSPGGMEEAESRMRFQAYGGDTRVARTAFATKVEDEGDGT